MTHPSFDHIKHSIYLAKLKGVLVRSRGGQAHGVLVPLVLKDIFFPDNLNNYFQISILNLIENSITAIFRFLQTADVTSSQDVFSPLSPDFYGDVHFYCADSPLTQCIVHHLHRVPPPSSLTTRAGRQLFAKQTCIGAV